LATFGLATIGALEPDVAAISNHHLAPEARLGRDLQLMREGEVKDSTLG